MSDDRNDPAIRKGALLLSALVLTPDEGLSAYRDRRVARKDVDAAQIAKARALLDAVGFVLRSESAEDWRKLERAHDTLRGVKAPSDEENADQAAPEERAPKEDEASSALAAAPKSPPSPLPVDAPAVMPPPAAAPKSPPSPPPVDAPAVMPPPAASPPPPPAPVASTAEAPRPPTSNVDATAFFDPSQLEVGDSLPFDPSAAAPPPAPVADQLPPRNHDIDETAAMGIHLDLGDTLPFESDDGETKRLTTSQLTIEQYASFCAERDLADEGGLGTVMARYRIQNADTLRDLDATWARRLEGGQERARFEELRARYRQWLARQHGG